MIRLALLGPATGKKAMLTDHSLISITFYEWKVGSIDCATYMRLRLYDQDAPDIYSVNSPTSLRRYIRR
jgi:hypothetical protein